MQREQGTKMNAALNRYRASANAVRHRGPIRLLLVAVDPVRGLGRRQQHRHSMRRSASEPPNPQSGPFDRPDRRALDRSPTSSGRWRRQTLDDEDLDMRHSSSQSASRTGSTQWFDRRRLRRHRALPRRRRHLGAHRRGDRAAVLTKCRDRRSTSSRGCCSTTATIRSDSHDSHSPTRPAPPRLFTCPAMPGVFLRQQSIRQRIGGAVGGASGDSSSKSFATSSRVFDSARC